jgi:low temperature requirement protein LtrA
VPPDATQGRAHAPRLNVALRHGDRVSALELFFDLVFVLAITQCTALMAHDPTWRGIGQGLVLLGLLWWSWVGYAWLTSVLDPDEGGVRLVLFAAMAALLVASLCVPRAFETQSEAGSRIALILALAYSAVRVAHIVLFTLASRDDGGLRRSVTGLAASTAIGVALLVAGALVDDAEVRLAVWALALVLDMGGPLVVDTSGWRLEPGHFAERHGLIVIVALGESIVAIGAGADTNVTGGVVLAALLGAIVASTFWWAYFDVVSLAIGQRLTDRQADVTSRNELARDAFSYLHLPLVAAIVLVALGMKVTLAHVHDPLTWETSFALAGGAAVYLLGHVAFTLRGLGVVAVPRLVAAVVLLALVPLGRQVDAVATLASVAAVLTVLLVAEHRRDVDHRRAVREAAHAAEHHDAG